MQRFTLLLFTAFLFGLHAPTLANDRDGEWTILATYTIPGKASGLAWDGTYLYFGIYGAQGDRVYRFDPATGTNQLQFTNPAIGDSYGMTFDGEHLWIIDRVGSPSYALQLDLNGNIISQFNLPDQYMSGIAYDDGDFWVATYHPNPGLIYKVDGAGNVLHQFVPPYDQPWDICLDGNNLWVVDYFGHKINKIDQDGNVLEDHDAENQRPAGIVFDGTYLWYVDGPLGSNSTLYKVDPTGTGMPEIAISQLNYNFGQVTIGSPEELIVEIGNTGTADLEFYFTVPVGTGLSMPDDIFTIGPNETIEVPATWNPTLPFQLNTNVEVHSNDPLQPVTLLNFTGYALVSGPHILIQWTTHDYGSIRMGATKRWTLSAQNYGDATLTIHSVDVDDSDFYIGDNVSLPINLGPLGMVHFDVWFWPKSAESYQATLSISNNDPDQNPFEINLLGSAVDQDYPIGEQLWTYHITGSWDNSPKAIGFIPDISGDGIPDVIICSEDNYVRAFNGNASGTSQVLWEREIYSGSVYQQNALSFPGDINDDGYDDLVVGTAWGDRSIVALSGKTGEILWKHQTNNYGAGGWVYQTDARFDYNGDGFPDVLAASGNDGDNTGPRRIYCLDGKTGVPIWETFIGSAAFAVMGIQDVNGDGIPDVLAGATSPGDTPGRVLGINGANGQVMWTYNTSGTAVFALEQLDDINDDGIPDVIAGSFNGNIYLLNPVNGQLISQGYLGNNLILQMFRLDDVNGDGYVDILPTKSGNALVVIDGKTGEQIYTKGMGDQPWNASPIPDITGNGINDIAVGTLFQNNYVYFLSGEDGTELFAAPFGEAVDALAVIPDITGDYSWEMVAGGREGKVVCYSGGLDTPVNLPEIWPKPETFYSTAFPNPFSDQTVISFNIPQRGEVAIRIYNINGSVVWQSPSQNLPEGSHTYTWKGSDSEGHKLKQGLYIYEIIYQSKTARGRIILLN
jgi:hypothetical protein